VNIDWSQLFELSTGNLGGMNFNEREDVYGNAPAGMFTEEFLPVHFMLDENACRAGTTVRAENDPVPAGDGSIQHLRFSDGMQATLKVQLWEADPGPTTSYPYKPAEGLQLLYGVDFLNRFLRDLVNSPGDPLAGDGQGRLAWSTDVPAFPYRMLDKIKLLSAPVWQKEDRVYTCEFTVDSPFPYALDLTEFQDDSWPSTLSNWGSAPTYPVWIIEPSNTIETLYYFTIRNDTYDLEIVYDADLPGASGVAPGDFIEINTFKNTAYLNGDGANMKPGIDIENSDFFPLFYGDNNIIVSAPGTFDPPTVICLWNYAYW